MVWIPKWISSGAELDKIVGRLAGNILFWRISTVTTLPSDVYGYVKSLAMCGAEIEIDVMAWTLGKFKRVPYVKCYESCYSI